MPILINLENNDLYTWEEDEAFLGRTVDCTIQVKHNVISRTHCVISRKDEDTFVIEDMASRNGTGLNGAEIPPSKEIRLRDGDIVNFGKLKFRFALEDPAVMQAREEALIKARARAKTKSKTEAEERDRKEARAKAGARKATVTAAAVLEATKAKAEAGAAKADAEAAKAQATAAIAEAQAAKAEAEAAKARAEAETAIARADADAAAKAEEEAAKAEEEALKAREAAQVADAEASEAREDAETTVEKIEETVQAAEEAFTTEFDEEAQTALEEDFEEEGEDDEVEPIIEPMVTFQEETATEVINWKAIFYGTSVFFMIVAGAFFYRLSFASDKQPKLKEFEFTVEKPATEEFELKEPMRDILQEEPEEIPEEMEVVERPDIQMTVVQTDVEVVQDVVMTENIEVDTPEIDIEAVEIDIDAPEEITEVAEAVTYAVNPIAADVHGPADIFKYEKPNPRSRPRLFTINRAPRPSRTLAVLPKEFGDQDAPTIGELGPANLNLFGTGDFYRTMTRFGGVEARTAVDSALHWLATHQEPNGIWSAAKHEGGGGVDSAASGLALMALMGGGHTTRKGEYRRNVMRGLEALIALQNKQNGAISGNIYCHSIATIALCEAYGRARDERIGLAARKAVDYLEKGVNPDGGWRYTANSGTSDMSVAGWGIQALKTAKLAQIKFDHSVYSRSLSYVDSVTDKGGAMDSAGGVGYTYVEGQNYGAGSANLTPAAMVVRQFSGVGVKSHLLVKGANLTKRSPPSWRSKNFYLWYYATYAMHNMGGEYRVWWNRRIRDVLIENQSREGDNAGSWDPKGASHGSSGGRVYTTAIGALCLEVYYRYSEALNSFGTAPDIDDLFLQ